MINTQGGSPLDAIEHWRARAEAAEAALAASREEADEWLRRLEVVGGKLDASEAALAALRAAVAATLPALMGGPLTPAAQVEVAEALAGALAPLEADRG